VHDQREQRFAGVSIDHRCDLEPVAIAEARHAFSFGSAEHRSKALAVCAAIIGEILVYRAFRLSQFLSQPHQLGPLIGVQRSRSVTLQSEEVRDL
jgi:hypothetical protein